MRIWLILAVFACLARADTHVYSRLDGEDLTLDYYRAEGKAPRPAAILVHGGGWVRGSREMAAMKDLAAMFNAVGIDAFSIDYRLAPKHPFPAPVEDVEAAVLWVRSRAKALGLDLRKLALVGGSAGGYLVNMAAVRGAKVAAVISFYGPSDFRNQPMNENRRALIGHLIDAKGMDAAYAEAAPAMNVTGREPPFLLLHGDRDPQVPMEQSVHMQMALQRAGVPCELILIPGGGHGLTGWAKLENPRPWKRDLLDWLRRAWKK